MSNNPSDHSSPGPEQPSASGPDWTSETIAGPPPGTGPSPGSNPGAGPGPGAPFAEPPRPSGDPTGGGPAGPTVGPPPPVARQLVRDPYSRLGGVASGLSHHYGVDVSLVRLAFVVFTLVTGFGIVFYALAWLIIPRANYWPPVGGRRPSKPLSAREIGIGLLVLGAFVAMFVNGGVFSQVLTPLVLVAGGIWLLTQSPPPTPAAAAPVAPAQPVDPVLPLAGAMPPGTPVAPRSRRRKGVVIGLVGAMFLLPILAIAGLVTAIAIAVTDFDAESSFSATYAPSTVDAIPTMIRHDQGEIILDLTQLEGVRFDEPVEIEVDLDIGEIEVIVPEGMEAAVVAEAALGGVTVFEDSQDGIKPNAERSSSDPDIILDIQLGVGDVTVTRANG